MSAVLSGRYYVDQLYLGNFEVIDSVSGLEVAQCAYYSDDFGTDEEVERDARARANAIAEGLNLIEFDWKIPLTDF